MEGDDLLAEQARYYDQRAVEYDEWWFRLGRHDRGERGNARWAEEVGELRTALEEFGPRGRVLELACGTGLWTRRLAGYAQELTAVDASSAMLTINRKRLGDPKVRYVQADLFAWEPDRAYDVCFFAFWLSHVPEPRFAPFWATVGRALGERGRVFFVDSASGTGSPPDPELPPGTTVRRLKDGREFTIVKRFYDPPALERELAKLGWHAEVRTTAESFIYGHAERA